MSQLFPVAGSKIFIGLKVAAKGEVTLADFAAQEPYWLEIDGWTSMGSLGDTQELITQAFINQNRVRKAKGTLTGASFENTFSPLVNDPGQIRLREAIKACKPYAFKVEAGAGCTEEGDVTFVSEAATPGVVEWPGHGLEPGSPVVFSVEGAGVLPTGITAGTTYFVRSDGFDIAEFTISATPGGAGIVTTGAGTAPMIATAQPAGQTFMFYGLAMPGNLPGGEANTALLRNWAIEIDSNIVEY